MRQEVAYAARDCGTLGNEPQDGFHLGERGGLPANAVANKIDIRTLRREIRSWPAARTKNVVIRGKVGRKVLGNPDVRPSELRRSGEFEIGHLAIPRAAYHMADLIVFSAKLKCVALSLSTKQNTGNGLGIEDGSARTLRSALKGAKFLATDGSAEVIRALLDGRIKAVGSVGDAAGDLLIRQIGFRRMILENRSMVFGATRSAKESALRLDCDATVVLHLAEAGYLKARVEEWGTRITEESLAEFSSNFVPLSSLAKKFDTSAARLTRICSRSGISLLQIQRSRVDCPQSFLSSRDVHMLKDLASENSIERSRRRLAAQKTTCGLNRQTVACHR